MRNGYNSKDQVDEYTGTIPTPLTSVVISTLSSENPDLTEPPTDINPKKGPLYSRICFFFRVEDELQIIEPVILPRIFWGWGTTIHPQNIGILVSKEGVV